LSRDEVDEELAEDNQSEEAAETKQDATRTLTTHTCIKNKFPNQFTEVLLLADKTRQNAKYAPIIIT
jgi:hypothetical protein